jgi:hypothetical protein
VFRPRFSSFVFRSSILSGAVSRVSECSGVLFLDRLLLDFDVLDHAAFGEP